MEPQTIVRICSSMAVLLLPTEMSLQLGLQRLTFRSILQTPMAGLWSEKVHHHLGLEAEALPKSENSSQKTRSKSLS